MASKIFKRDLPDAVMTAIEHEMNGDIVAPFYTLHRRLQSEHGAVVLKTVLDEYNVAYEHAQKTWASVIGSWKSQWLHSNSDVITGDDLSAFETLLSETEIGERDRFAFGTILYRLISQDHRNILERMAKTEAMPPAKTTGKKKRKRGSDNTERDICDLHRWFLHPWSSIVAMAERDEPECKKLRADAANIYLALQQMAHQHQLEHGSEQKLKHEHAEGEHDGAAGEYAEGEMHGKGTYTFPDGAVDVVRFEADAPVGQAVRWSADRTEAWELQAGEEVRGIPLDEAAQIAERIGLPPP